MGALMKNNRKGFGLAEVIVTMLLVAIAAITALGFIVFCGRFVQQPELRLESANFGRETMEDLSMGSYASLVDGGPYSQLPMGGSGYKGLQGTHGGNRTYSVKSNSDYKTITVSVTWTQ